MRSALTCQQQPSMVALFKWRADPLNCHCRCPWPAAGADLARAQAGSRGPNRAAAPARSEAGGQADSSSLARRFEAPCPHTSRCGFAPAARPALPPRRARCPGDRAILRQGPLRTRGVSASGPFVHYSLQGNHAHLIVEDGDSITFDVRRCFQCSAGKSKNVSSTSASFSSVVTAFGYFGAVLGGDRVIASALGSRHDVGTASRGWAPGACQGYAELGPIPLLRVFGHTSRTAAQKPSAPSPTATTGARMPRRFRSRSTVFQLSALSR